MKCRKAVPCLAVGDGLFGVWRCLPGALACASISPRGETALAGLSSPRGSGPGGWACALNPGQTCRLAPLRAAGPFGAGGFLTGLPCGASQPVPPCHPDRSPGEMAPLVVAAHSEAVTPKPLRLRRFRAGRPFPACGVALDHPASNAAKCIDRAAEFQASYDAP